MTDDNNSSRDSGGGGDDNNGGCVGNDGGYRGDGGDRVKHRQQSATMTTAATTTTATATVAVGATKAAAAAAVAMATATAIAMTAMLMARRQWRQMFNFVRGRSRMLGFGGSDDLSPLFWFLRSAHCALCPPLVRVTPPAVGRKQFAPAPGR